MKYLIPAAGLAAVLALSACQKKTEAVPAEPVASTDATTPLPAEATAVGTDAATGSAPSATGSAEMPATSGEAGAMSTPPTAGAPPEGSPSASPNGTGTGQLGGGPKPK